MLSEQDVTGLITGDRDAYDHVVTFARKCALRHQHRNLSREDARDIVQEGLLAAIHATQTRDAATPEHLANTIRNAVRTHADDFHRRNASEVYSITGGPDLLFRGRRSFQPHDLREPIRALYKTAKRPEQDARARLDLIAVDGELIRFLSAHPEMMYELNPRRFEELVAEILKAKGYSVELTTNSADGGVDIFATQKTDIGEALLIVDCKRYAAGNPVGVEIVRSLFGIGEQLRASMSMIATTSYFTAPAREFQQTVRHRLSLKAYSDLQLWLNNYQPH